MTTLLTASPSEVLYKAASKAAGRRRSVALRRLPLIIGLALLAIAILAITFAPLLTSAAPNQIDVLNPLAPPLTPGHLLGTDQFGRDVWSRILYGGRIDLAIAFGATSVTLVGGTIIGLVAGYFGGRIDNVLMRIVDLFFAFPFLVLIIAIIAMLGPSLLNIFLAIWITSWVAYARIMRAQVIVAKKQQYVLAARALGYSRTRVMLRHILPNTASAVIIFSGIGMPAAVSLTYASGLAHEVTSAQRSFGTDFRKLQTPDSGTTPSVSSISPRRMTSFSNAGSTAFGKSSFIVDRLGRPWALRTVSSGSKPCSMAHFVHTRATAGVESTNTPSKSNSSPRQEISTMIKHNRRGTTCAGAAHAGGGRRGGGRHRLRPRGHR